MPKGYLHMEVADPVLPLQSNQTAVPIALDINPNEKAYLLEERNVQAANYSGARRYQFIWVNREGQLAVHIREQGKTDEKQAYSGEFIIPSDWEHSVAELLDLADFMREDKGLDEVLLQAHEESTLISDAVTLAQVSEEIKQNRTVFGAGQTAPTSQRTGFHRST